MPWAVELVSEVGSTNTVLVERARQGAAAGAVLVADYQTAGRGRLDRPWEAPPGSSLLVSVLVRPMVDVEEAARLAMAAGLAAVEACEVVAGVRPDLKWPNDLVLGSPARKLAGLLAETVLEGRTVVAAVIGMGLNLNWPQQMPHELAGTATSLNWHAGFPIDRDAILKAWLDGLGRRLDIGAGLLDEYRARCSTIGHWVRAEWVVGGEAVTGLATGVDDRGRLLVEADGRTHAVDVGDVLHLRPAIRSGCD